MKSSLGISNFLEEISSLSHSVISSISLHWSLRKAFLSLLDILWNSAFRWIYLSWRYMVLWWPTRPSRTNTKKRCPSYHGRLECKSRRWRETWSNRKFGLVGQNEAGQRLTVFCQENPLVRANTLFQWHKKRLYIWASPDGQYLSQIDYILCSQTWRSSIQSAKTQSGPNCGLGPELFFLCPDNTLLLSNKKITDTGYNIV